MRESLFDNISYSLSENLRKAVFSLGYEVAQKTEEIRIRKSQPLALTVRGKTYFVTQSFGISLSPCDSMFNVTEQDLNETFRLLCGYSPFAHENELKEGFIMMKNGCRAGVCGTYNRDGLLNSVTSVNIRIAREVRGSADKIVTGLKSGGLLIAGPPGSGKTTVLRDLIRQLSSGKAGEPLRICVIDSRGELSGTKSQDSLGVNTDVIICKNKAFGMEKALRTMFPQVIAFDEIGTLEELKLINECFFAGVRIITTAHIGHGGELMKRGITASLIESGVLSQIALLDRDKNITLKTVV